MTSTKNTVATADADATATNTVTANKPPRTVANSTRAHAAKALGVKRFNSAYFQYLGSRRNAYKQEHNDLAPKAVVSGVSVEWNAFSDAEKEQYVQMSQEDKERYNRELDEAIAAFISENGENAILPEVKTSNKREKKPKRVTIGKALGVTGARTAYILYCTSNREKVVASNPDESQREILSILAKQWKKASARTKGKFKKEATADRKRYERELKAAMAANPEIVENLPGRKKRSGPKRARTAYLYFCQQQRPVVKTENPEQDVREQTRTLGARWKALTEAERQPYATLASEDKERYARELAEYKAANAQNTIVEETESTSTSTRTKTKTSRSSKSASSTKRQTKKVKRARKKGTPVASVQA
jgi:hypothetical protein